MTRLGLFIGAVFVLLGAVIVALAEFGGARVDCASRDIAAITMIEEHGRAADVPSDRLYGAALLMQQARQACRNARFDEARALYGLVLLLGPVVSHETEE